ncbi:DUF1202 family protein [Klebsiella oxytoca]|uniref:DUF1202 family protein n=1 Tax=Klebsiella oxytoca TaxID=571 RepID=UPI0018AC3518|nr:DUF1202 family protein [Klebsiella oxytoca]MBF8468134.1 DUF1202 family protein [Klebsiella oxytoca]MBZ7701811.1 DUF1202 family protein [Klebsiella oxytoca]
MKYAWKTLTVLMIASPCHVLADANTPTDDVVKQQFAEQTGGIMRLQNVTLKQLDARGNQATYMLEGDMAAAEDLYIRVGVAGDYFFYERVWTRGRPVKFSAMMTAVGTKDSGWQTEFFSLQMAAKRGGRTFKEIGGDESKTLIVNDHKFMAQFAKIDASFAASKATMKTLQGQQDALKTEIAALEERINRSWGTDANGKPLDRSNVQQAMLEKMYEVDRQNDPLKFENHYYKTLYEPALAACQKKAVCDAVLNEQKRNYYRQHKEMSENIKAEMAARDKKIAPLQKQKGELNTQLMALEIRYRELARDEKYWQEGLEKMRRNGVLK